MRRVRLEAAGGAAERVLQHNLQLLERCGRQANTGAAKRQRASGATAVGPHVRMPAARGAPLCPLQSSAAPGCTAFHAAEPLFEFTLMAKTKMQRAGADSITSTRVFAALMGACGTAGACTVHARRHSTVNCSGNETHAAAAAAAAAAGRWSGLQHVPQPLHTHLVKRDRRQHDKAGWRKQHRQCRLHRGVQLRLLDCHAAWGATRARARLRPKPHADGVHACFDCRPNELDRRAHTNGERRQFFCKSCCCAAACCTARHQARWCGRAEGHTLPKPRLRRP